MLETIDGPIQFGVYPDGMPLSIRQSDDTKFLLRPDSLEEFARAAWWLQAHVWRGGSIEHLVVPCFPGARQDRMNSGGDQMFTLKSAAHLVNSLGARNVHVFDPHSDVTAALVHNCRVHNSAVYAGRMGTVDGVIAPDAGAERRAFAWAEQLRVPLYRASKHRDVATGAITAFACEPLPLGRHLIVDDLCDGGGTFVGLAMTVREQSPGVALGLYVTHGLFTRGMESLAPLFDLIYTTDSVVRPSSDTVIVAPIVKEFFNDL